MRTSPSAARNREPILAVLQRVLPPRGLVLEAASGTGEHAVFFAGAMPAIEWQPTDAEAEPLEAIEAHRRLAGLPNLRPALPWDVRRGPPPVGATDALLAINLIHISPPETTPALLRAGAALLQPGAPLVLYGPFREAGVPLAPSNDAFDRSLRERDPSWGLRDLEAVAAEAARHGFGPAERVAMPANNLAVILRKA